MQALRILFVVVFLGGLLAALPNTTLAQTDPAACNALVKKAVQDLQTSCQNIGQGSICYGHDSVEATFTDAGQQASFHQPGDQVKLNLLKTVHTSAADLTSGKLGSAVINFGAADANVTTGTMALMLGDMSFNFATTPASSQANFTPAQSFYFHPPSSQPLCDQAAPLFAVQSPENNAVPLSINGSDVQLKGLITFHWESANSLSATAHQGSLEVVGGPTAQQGQTLVAVADNDGNIVLWSDQRPATAKETQDVENLQGLSGSLAAFAAGCSQPATHVVASGEDLYRISLQYNTTVAAISAANNITNPNLIYAGQSLVIPPCGQGNQAVSAPQPASAGQSNQVARTAQPLSAGGGPSTPIASTPQQVVGSNGPNCSSSYVVTAGDNLANIANSMNSNMAAIMAANDLNNVSSLFVGQHLIIPCH